MNVFWQVGTSATIGVNSFFYGNLLADQSITIDNGATFQGRAMAINAAVTMDTNNMMGPEVFGVPEPGTLSLVALALGVFGFTQRRRLRAVLVG